MSIGVAACPKDPADSSHDADNAHGQAPKLVPIAEAIQRAIAQGRYRVESVHTRVDRCGAKYFAIELADVTGSAVFLAWENRLPAAGDLKPGTIVEVATYVRNVDSRPYAKLGRVTPIVDPTLEDRLSTLPMPACPIPGVVERMCKVLAAITRIELRTFLTRLFGDGGLLGLFLTVKASADDHHDRLGGLALHSVEAAEIVASIPMLAQHEREIAVVAALTHDIGKVRTLSGTPDAEVRKRLVEHDALTLEILGPALAELDVLWPDAALAIRHILTSEAPGSRYGTPERSPMAVAMRSADRLSQQIDLQRKRLGTSPGIASLPRYRWIWAAGASKSTK